MAAGHTEYYLHEELELLEAIYIHELTVEGPQERPDSLSVLLHPSTCDEEDKQYVCLTLVIVLTDKYPDSCPSLSIKAPRGLSEAHINSILSNLRELAESRLGGPMLYELIEYAKESLTDNNVPSCACAICLCHFQESDSFTRTECYHYFHCSCLVRLIDYSLRAKETEDDKHSEQVECPVCRLPVTYDLNVLRESVSVESEPDEDRYEADEAMKKLQQKMARLFTRQQKKGGIIDVERERNKFVIGISSPKTAICNSDQPAGGIHKGDKQSETVGEPDKPVRQDRREQQECGKKGGTSNKHKRSRKKKLAIDGTLWRKEARKESTDKTDATRTVGDKQQTEERKDYKRDGGKMSDRKHTQTELSYKASCADSRGTKQDEKQTEAQRENRKILERKHNQTELSCKASCTDSRGTKQDEKQSQAQRENRKIRERKRNPKCEGWEGVQRTVYEQNCSADLKTGGSKHTETSKTKNCGERSDSLRKVGKERDGKERDRKERDGKERDGKERDGKERDGKSRDGKSRDGKSRDGKEKDGKEKDGKEKDGKEKDGKEKDGKLGSLLTSPLPKENFDSNKKERGPRPGFRELPDRTRRTVKPPPGFENAGGNSSG